MQPVNSFRMIFNYYFDGEYELLEPEQYIIPNKCEYIDLLTVTPHEGAGVLNSDLGDHMVFVYNGIDAEGELEFHIFAITDAGEKGELLFTIPREVVEPFADNPPEQNTVVFRQGQVAFSVITTGEFQFNIGPDDEGREWAVIVNDFPAQEVYGYEVGAN